MNVAHLHRQAFAQPQPAQIDQPQRHREAGLWCLAIWRPRAAHARGTRATAVSGRAGVSLDWRRPHSEEQTGETPSVLRGTRATAGETPALPETPVLPLRGEWRLLRACPKTAFFRKRPKRGTRVRAGHRGAWLFWGRRRHLGLCLGRQGRFSYVFGNTIPDRGVAAGDFAEFSPGAGRLRPPSWLAPPLLGLARSSVAPAPTDCASAPPSSPRAFAPRSLWLGRGCR